MLGRDLNRLSAVIALCALGCGLLLAGSVASGTLLAQDVSPAMAGGREAPQDGPAETAPAPRGEAPLPSDTQTSPDVPAATADAPHEQDPPEYLSDLDRDEIRRQAREAAEQAREAVRLALRELDIEAIAAQARDAARLALQDIDVDEIRRQARDAAEKAGEAAALALRDLDIEAIAAQARAAAAQWGGPPRIGLSVRDVTAEEAKAAGRDVIAGAWVTAVVEGAPAATAGLAAGDVIVKVDDEVIRSARHLTRVVAETPVGRAVRITYVRDGREAEVSVAPAENQTRAFSFRNAFPDGVLRDMDRPGRMMQASRGGRLGVTTQPLTPQLAAYFGTTEGGALVVEVRDGSAAARAGIKAGDVITKVGDNSVARPGDVTRALADREPGSTVALQIVRDRQPQTIEVALDTRPMRTPAAASGHARTTA